jgi:hypothetical protein
MKPRYVPGYRVTFHDWVTEHPDTGVRTYMTEYRRETLVERIDTWGRRNMWWMVPLTGLMWLAVVILMIIGLARR